MLSYSFLTTNTFPSTNLNRIVQGDGLTITDEKGRQYLDLSSSTLNMALGHKHPEMVRTFASQIEKIWFVPMNFQTSASLELGKLLVDLAPKGITAVNMRHCNGSDAVDTAIKMARLHTRRNKILCVNGAWHGVSSGVLPLSFHHKYYRVSNQIDVYYSANCTLESLIKLIEDHHDAAAVVVDPVGTSVGIFEPSTVQQNLQSIRELCTKYGILFIFDEVQTFGGYLGSKLFAADYYDVTPDIICIGKALGGGLPQAATLCRSDLRGVVAKGEGEFTHGGQVLGCIASIQAIKSFISMSDKVLQNLASLQKSVEDLKQKFPMLQIRQIGFFVSISLKLTCFVKNWVKRVHQIALEHKLLIRNNHNVCILLKPPVIISPEVSEQSFTILANVLSAANQELMRPSVFFDDLTSNGTKITLLTRIRKKRPLLKKIPEIQALLTAVKPTLFVEVLDLQDEIKCVQKFRDHGICVPQLLASEDGYAESLYQPGSAMNLVLDQASDSSVVNSIILQHQRYIEMAHDAGFSIANRSPCNAIISGVDVYLINFELAYTDSSGDTKFLFAFEEILSVLQCLACIKDASFRNDLATRLCFGILDRHGSSLALEVWKGLSKCYSATITSPGSMHYVTEAVATITEAMSNHDGTFI